MTSTTLPFLAAAVSTSGATPPAAADPAALDNQLAALAAYKTGSARGSLMPLDDAIVASLKDESLRQQLAQRLAALLKTDLSIPAQEYICSKLALIGSAQSVPALAQLLEHKELGEAARAALEVIPGGESHAALRDSLPRVSGAKKAGVLNSLGTFHDPDDWQVLTPLLQDSDYQVASAAAAALGAIGTLKAAETLAKASVTGPESLRLSVLDARLACAERLLASGSKPEAVAIYKALSATEHPKQVQLAARRGLLAAVQQK